MMDKEIEIMDKIQKDKIEIRNRIYKLNEKCFLKVESTSTPIIVKL